MMTKALNDVIAERERQQSAEGWTVEHDDHHKRGELVEAALGYATSAMFANIYCAGDTADCPVPVNWPWLKAWWKPKNSRRDLVRATALLLAEIDRMDRAIAQTADIDRAEP